MTNSMDMVYVQHIRYFAEKETGWTLKRKRYSTSLDVREIYM